MMPNLGRGRGQVWVALVFLFAATATGAGCDAGNLGAGPDGGNSSGGPDGRAAQPDALACGDLSLSASWALTPAVSQLTGVVTDKAVTGGAESFTIVDAGGAEYHLELNLGMPVPIEAGEQIDVTTAVYRAFMYYRTLDVKIDGVPVVYATEVAQPSLPPPLMLEVGDSSCLADVPPAITIHQLRAADDGGEPVVIDGRQQAQVGRFRVFNDRIVRFPPGAEDATDRFQVVVVRSPR